VKRSGGADITISRIMPESGMKLWTTAFRSWMSIFLRSISPETSGFRIIELEPGSALVRMETSKNYLTTS